MQKRLQKLKGLYKYLVASIILAIPLFPKFPLINIFGTYVAVRLEDFLLLFTFIIWFGLSLSALKKFIKNSIYRSILLYLAVGFLSTLFGIIILKTVAPQIGFLHWLRRVEYFTAFFIGILAIKNRPKDIHFYFKLIPLVIIFIFIYGYGQRYFGWPIIITQNMEYSKGVALRWIPGSHINSTFAGHYDLSTYLVLVLPSIVLGFFLIKGTLSKIIFGSTFFFSLWLMVNAASRISLVSYLASVIVALILVKRYRAIIAVTLITIVFVGFSSNLIARYTRVFEVAKEKLMSFDIKAITLNQDVYASDDSVLPRRENIVPTPTPPPVFEDRSTSIRLNVEWPRALRAFAKNPLLGTGYSSITLATDNDYLRLLGETGLLGLASFFLILIRIVLTFIKEYPFGKSFKGTELIFLCGIFSALIGILMNAAFIDIFEASKFAISFWLLLGMAVALLADKAYEE
jgi:hypothetical protein